MGIPDIQLPALSGFAEGLGLPAAAFEEAAQSAEVRGVPLAKILHVEYGVPRSVLLEALSAHYRCAAIEYDERLPIPPELLTSVSASLLSKGTWFPVIKDVDGTVVIATTDPASADVRAQVKSVFGPGPFEFRVTLPDDIQWFIQDFLHAKPGELIGTERTGLAFWRNTMAQWRTRLACYRTDMARARTALSFTRGGLGLVAIANALTRSHAFRAPGFLIVLIMAAGLGMISYWLPVYLKVRRSRLSPPRHQTLVEVTAATLLFLEGYHFPEGLEMKTQTKGTMLARLGDFLANYCTIFYPKPASRERTHLARERNVLAAQRTIAGCYRTIYSRARTGLAFIRTGVSFTSFGIGLMTYFGLGIQSLFDGMLIVVGLLMIVDGILWYMPVRREQAELPRTRSAVLA